jgi:hypothetical protein
MRTERSLSLLRRLFGMHLARQDAVLDELRALRQGQQEVAARLDAAQAGLAQLRTALQHGQAQCREIANVALVGADGRYADPLSLGRHHAQVYSQNGEDGVVAEIFRRIGARDRFFVEVGVGTGVENNTRLLLEQGWRGVWVEGSRAGAEEAARRFASPMAQGRLTIVAGMATPDNLDALLDKAGVPEAFDFLSLDVDQHTSHLWRALRRRSRVACIEYNASIPPSVCLEVPYEPSQSWDGTSWFGASLKALERIGSDKGLHLVGCEMVGANAFFVAAEETGGRFRAPFAAEAHWEPPRYSLLARTGHRRAETGRSWVEGA